MSLKVSEFHHCRAGGLLWLVLATCFLRPFAAGGATDETFPVLQIGTHVYTNVTVTTKAKNDIFIVHAGGMGNIKIADLPADLREKLGYAAAEKRKTTTNGAAAWAKAEVAKLGGARITEVRKQLEQKWRAGKTAGVPTLSLVLSWGRSPLILAVLVFSLFLYLFCCYCGLLICRKTGKPASILIWLPVLQLFPLLRAAGMSGWWFAAYLVPVVNVVAQILWSVNIAKARGKSGWVALFLVLPLTSFFAFLYLAFSNGGPAGEEDKGPEIMTLQTV